MDENVQKPKYKTLELEGVKYRTLLSAKFNNRKKYEPENPKLIKAFIPGTIVKILTKKGRKVEEGEDLLVLEAMKMQSFVQATIPGKVKSINVKKGQMVPKGFVMIELA
ncbi:MAG: biotin/lipoyl-binding protein [bacterium]|jgi:biotin carboxyl carrier protein